MLHLQVDQREADLRYWELNKAFSRKLTKLQFHKAGMLQNCIFWSYNTGRVPNASQKENPYIFCPGL